MIMDEDKKKGLMYILVVVIVTLAIFFATIYFRTRAFQDGF
jgi:hypothetical protein